MELWRDVTDMLTNPTPFERRLRLLIAREFASRGYYLDAEGFYNRVEIPDLNADELVLLIHCATATNAQSPLDARMKHLAHLDPTLALQLRETLKSAKPPASLSSRAFNFLQKACCFLKRGKKACS